ncbi:hypothetical protein Pint_08876 [Pistacia integerrima]|uniref:Uncharacterized protein n=1 Tax=Pistacia integerrima TaxID=434235 RepID=A0ACC0XRB7_9ROSI|nr:hypothetical protein Pint_08876 [Pistacia integerrima]
MAGKYGPTFNVRLGSRCASVPFWREMQKIATFELLSDRRLEMLKHVRLSEVDMSIRQLYSLWVKNNSFPVLVDLKKWLEDMTLNVVVRMVAGKHYLGAPVDMTGTPGLTTSGHHHLSIKHSMN